MKPTTIYVRQITTGGHPRPIVQFRTKTESSAEAAHTAVKEARNNPLTAYKRKRTPKNTLVP